MTYNSNQNPLTAPMGALNPSNVVVPINVDGSGNLLTSSSGGGGGGAVTAVSGAFVANSIVDLTTLIANTADLLADGDHLAPIDTTTGATGDAAVTGDNTGSLSAKLRGLSKMLFDMWDSTNHWLQVKVMNGNANGQTTMSASAPIAVASDQTPVPMDIARVLGSALSISNPNITETNYQNAARNGKMYTAQARNTTAGTIIVGLAVFNPSAGGKTIAITSIQVSLSASTNALGNSLYLQTVDPALGTPVTPVNLKPGGAASTASCSSTNTVVVPAGTLAKGFGTVATTTNEVLSPNQVILLPAGSANGVTMYVTPATVVWSVAITWIEF